MATFNAIASTKVGSNALNYGKAHALSTSSIVPVIAGYIYAGFKPEHAEKIDAWLNHAVAEKRKVKTGVLQVTRLSTSPRLSEMKGMLKCADWACHAELFSELHTLDVSLAMLVKVTTWFRKDSGIDKAKGVCPSRDELRRVIAAKQPKKGGRKPKTLAEIVKAKPVAMFAELEGNVKAFASQFGKRDGGAFIAAMVKACASYRPIIAKIAKADAAEAKAAAAE